MSAPKLPPLPHHPEPQIMRLTELELQSIGLACWKQGLEDAAKVAEAATQEYDPHFGRPLNLAYQCADAIRALAKEITP